MLQQQQRRLLHHIRQQFTPPSRLIASNNARNSVPCIQQATELANGKSHTYVQMSSRRNALAGASIVALGAGAVLCARAYSKSSSRSSSRSTNGTGTTSREALSTARSKTAETPPAEASGKINGIVGAEGAADTCPPPAPKQPCGGCDCGLMEPGPLEGTMHAYERHIIICR